MSHFQDLKKLLSEKKTLLGVGPMSVNVVDSAIELSDKYKVPLILIASRRQIDFDYLGGGYVNNWTTQNFSDYVKKKSKFNKIILARDHGGPWQNDKEIQQKFRIDKAMDVAKKSFEEDIRNDFKLIHIDTSLNPFSKKKLSIHESLRRVFELYEYCCKISKSYKKEIMIEIGTEEQSGTTNTFEELEFTLRKMREFTNKKNLQKLDFIVIQSGTRVFEDKNIGTFENYLRIDNEIPVEIQLLKVLEICKKYNVYMKEHNSDYLSDESLIWHPRLGIHAANVAPEFALAETAAFFQILENFQLKEISDEFIRIAVNSNKWRKWTEKNSNLSDKKKALLCGHYIYSSDSFKKIFAYTDKFLKKKKINLNQVLKNKIKIKILRYMNAFRLV